MDSRQLLIAALRSAVTGKPCQLPPQVDWQAFSDFAAFHNVQALAYSGLKNADIPEREKKTFQLAYNLAIYRDSQLEYTKAGLQTRLEEAGVPHIFLKGAVLKHNYPIPALRTMTDLDVLVRTEDYPAIDKIAQAMGGELFRGDGNHRNFLFPGNVKVEFHPNLLHHATPVAARINPGWQYARGNSMTEEGFYLSILAHIAEHFVSGGIGVRFLLDIWVFRNLRKQPYDRAFVEGELEKFSLLEFTQNLEKLSEVWFGEEAPTPVLTELGEYILTSGIHGLEKREMLNAVTISGGRAGALWRKAFYPRQELEDRYTWAKGRPLLLPAAWCCRAFRAVTRRGDQIRSWHKGTGSFTRKQIKEQQQKLKRFGLQWK
jgi:hypothetical protein